MCKHGNCGSILASFAYMLRVKSIVTFAIVFTTCFLVIEGHIDSTAFMTIASSIITYYFTRKDASETDGKSDKAASNVYTRLDQMSSSSSSSSSSTS